MLLSIPLIFKILLINSSAKSFCPKLIEIPIISNLSLFSTFSISFIVVLNCISIIFTFAFCCFLKYAAIDAVDKFNLGIGKFSSTHIFIKHTLGIFSLSLKLLITAISFSNLTLSILYSFNKYALDLSDFSLKTYNSLLI